MALFLNIAGSACMLIFLMLLIWRGCSQLGWLPKHFACPFAVSSGRHAMPLRCQGEGAPAAVVPYHWAEAVFWFFASILLGWLFMWLGFRCAGQQVWNNFFTYAWQRLTTAGDAAHYQYLAEQWYASTGDAVNLIVFYPLYPLCLKIFSLFTFGNVAFAGVAFSQLCWGFAAVSMRRLAARFYAQAVARVATLSMLLFPFSFFAMGMFTESLFLLLTILTLDAITTCRFVRAGVLGCFAALCRTQGVLLLLAAVYGFLQWCKGKKAGEQCRRALPLALIPVGYLLYLGLNWYYCGTPFAFLYYQSIAPWYQHADWIGNNLAQQWGMSLAYPGLAKYIYFPQIILYFTAMALLLYGVWVGVSLPLLLYGGAYIGASYLSSWLISGSRYVFGCATLYLIIGQIKSRGVQWGLLLLQAIALIYYACCFMQGQSIM